MQIPPKTEVKVPFPRVTIERSIYFVHLGPIFFIYLCARDTSKAGKKSFSVGINRIDCRLRHDFAAARNNEKTKKILYRC